MERIGSRLGDHIDDGSGVAADISAVEIGLNFELTHAFYRGPKHDGECKTLIVIHTVIEEVVISLAVAVGEDF